jgi:hypothetical protein
MPPPRDFFSETSSDRWRFSLQTVFLFITVLAGVLAIARHDIGRAILGALLAILLLIWIYDESRAPHELHPFP